MKISKCAFVCTCNCVCVCSIDGTQARGLGRMVNDARAGNCKMKKVITDDGVHLCLFAVTNIAIGEQLLFNYGDTSDQLFWRQKVGSVL